MGACRIFWPKCWQRPTISKTRKIPGAQTVREEVEQRGIRAALMRFSGLSEESPEEKVLLQLVEARFYEMGSAEATELPY